MPNFKKKNATKILTVAIPKCQISKKETPPNFVRKVIFCSFCKGLFEKTSHQKFWQLRSLNAKLKKKTPPKFWQLRSLSAKFQKKNATKILTVAIPKCQKRCSSRPGRPLPSSTLGTLPERPPQTQNIGETCFLLSINPLSIFGFTSRVSWLI